MDGRLVIPDAVEAVQARDTGLVVAVCRGTGVSAWRVDGVPEPQRVWFVPLKDWCRVSMMDAATGSVVCNFGGGRPNILVDGRTGTVLCDPGDIRFDEDSKDRALVEMSLFADSRLQVHPAGSRRCIVHAPYLFTGRDGLYCIDVTSGYMRHEAHVVAATRIVRYLPKVVTDLGEDHEVLVPTAVNAVAMLLWILKLARLLRAPLWQMWLGPILVLLMWAVMKWAAKVSTGQSRELELNTGFPTLAAVLPMLHADRVVTMPMAVAWVPIAVYCVWRAAMVWQRDDIMRPLAAGCGLAAVAVVLATVGHDLGSTPLVVAGMYAAVCAAAVPCAWITWNANVYESSRELFGTAMLLPPLVSAVLALLNMLAVTSLPLYGVLIPAALTAPVLVVVA